MLLISASTSFAHDFWTNVIHAGVERFPGEERLVARVAAFVVGAIAIAIAIVLGPTANVAFLVALAFAVAASPEPCSGPFLVRGIPIPSRRTRSPSQHWTRFEKGNRSLVLSGGGEFFISPPLPRI